MFQDQVGRLFDAAMTSITATMGWFFILAVNVFIISVVVYAFGRFGSIRIGGKDAKSEFSTVSWYAMLLSAGMGIGLMFWSVGEPILHYGHPSPMFEGLSPNTPGAAQTAMSVISSAVNADVATALFAMLKTIHLLNYYP